MTRPPQLEERFLKSVEGFITLQTDLRDKPELQPISRDLYRPDLDLAPAAPAVGTIPPTDVTPGAGVVPVTEVAATADATTADATTADATTADAPEGAAHAELLGTVNSTDLHTASLMLQAMENALVHAQLDRYHAHPLNAGWMNVFQRWSNSSLLRRCWPILRHEYSRDFDSFCRRELSLKQEFGLLERWPENPAGSHFAMIWDRLCAEFQWEWPEEANPPRRGEVEPLKRGLHSFVVDESGRSVSQPPLWFIRGRVQNSTLAPNDPLRNDPLKEGFIHGVIGLRPLPEGWKFNRDEIRQGLSEPPAERDAYELFIWVRPGFRQHRAGQAMLEEFLEQLGPRGLLPQGTRVVVAYPKSGWLGSGNRLARSQWMSFFSFYGFRKPGRTWPQSNDYELLVMNVK